MSEQDRTGSSGKRRQGDAGTARGDDPFAVRLDPNAPPGEISFLIPKRSPSAGGKKLDVSAPNTEGSVPPVLVPACEQVLDFILGLDEPLPTGLGRLMKKNKGS